MFRFYDGYHFWGMHLIWWIIWLFFVIWLFLTLARYGREKDEDSSYDILRKRFAKGEISREQYLEDKNAPEEDFRKIYEENKDKSHT